MKTYRLLTAVVLLVVCSSTMKAGYYYDHIFNNDFGNIEVPYYSVDAENNPILLSAAVAYPTVTENGVQKPVTIKYVVLHNHGTIMNDEQRPTGSNPLDSNKLLFPKGIVNNMANFGALVIQCDYIGYGLSKDYVHPYLNPNLTARNVLDGYKAAMDTIKARGYELADDYYTLNMGYSQGGQVTMSVQRYLETYASQELRDLVRLKRSICGGGPYNMYYIFEDLSQQTSLKYPCSLPLTIEGLYSAYKNVCMRDVNPDDVYVSKAFRKYICDRINTKKYDTEKIDSLIHKYFNKADVTVEDMFNKDILLGDTPASRGIAKALQKCNLLDGSWMPETPIVMFHYTKDEVVQYGNAEQAVALFGDKVTFYNEDSNLGAIIYAKDQQIATMLQTLTAAATPCHSFYGFLFYAAVAVGAL